MQAKQVKELRKPVMVGKISDESFITLFMIGVLVIVFAIASAIVPNFFTAQNMLNLVTKTGL